MGYPPKSVYHYTQIAEIVARRKKGQAQSNRKRRWFNHRLFPLFPESFGTFFPYQQEGGVFCPFWLIFKVVHPVSPAWPPWAVAWMVKEVSVGVPEKVS